MSEGHMIGMTGGRAKIYLYYEDVEDRVCIEQTRPHQILRLMSLDEWEEIEDQIIASRLKKIRNGCGKLPKTTCGQTERDKDRLLENFKNLLNSAKI